MAQSATRSVFAGHPVEVGIAYREHILFRVIDFYHMIAYTRIKKSVYD